MFSIFRKKLNISLEDAIQIAIENKMQIHHNERCIYKSGDIFIILNFNEEYKNVNYEESRQSEIKSAIEQFLQ